MDRQILTRGGLSCGLGSTGPILWAMGFLVQSSCSFLNLRTKIRWLNTKHTTEVSVTVTLEDHPIH